MQNDCDFSQLYSARKHRYLYMNMQTCIHLDFILCLQKQSNTQRLKNDV